LDSRFIMLQPLATAKAAKAMAAKDMRDLRREVMINSLNA
jgi:hypothetical protein